MSNLREAAQQALDWLYDNDILHPTKVSEDLRVALAQQDEPQTLDEALTLPRTMAQAYEAGYNAGVAHEREAYEAGYKAGVAHEREACAKVCEARFVGDLNREDMEARRCAAAIRARGNP